MKSVFTAVFFLGFFILANAQYTETINSNRPGASFGAYSVGSNVIQAEGGIGFGKDKHSLRRTETDFMFLDYALRYGLIFEELEIILEGRFTSAEKKLSFNGGVSEFSNFEANTLGAKYLIYDPHKKRQLDGPNLLSYHANNSLQWKDLIPAVSVYGGFNLLFGDNPFVFEGEPGITPKFAISTQNNFDRTVLVINLIADKLGSDFPSYSGIFTVTHALDNQYSVFGELQTIISDVYSDELLRFGGAYLLNKDLQLDVFGLVNFKNTPQRWLVGLGVSYRFDALHQDKYLDMGDDELKEEEEKKQKQIKSIDLN